MTLFDTFTHTLATLTSPSTLLRKEIQHTRSRSTGWRSSRKCRRGSAARRHCLTLALRSGWYAPLFLHAQLTVCMMAERTGSLKSEGQNIQAQMVHLQEPISVLVLLTKTYQYYVHLNH